jgi:hypothetical protein
MARGTPLKIIRWKDLEIISWIWIIFSGASINQSAKLS